MQPNANRGTSLGQINFMNCLPLNYTFEKWHLQDITISSGYPTFINQMFADKLLHVSPVSSVEYLQNKSAYSLIETVCISSDDNVASVILFSNHQLNELQRKKIAVPYTSATSIALLKVLLRENNVNPDECVFVKHKYAAPLENVLKTEFDAILYIGDPALIANTNYKQGSFYKYDLGFEWKKLTGYPMVFASWVAWSDWKNTNEDEFERISLLLDKAVDAGLDMYFNNVVELASTKLGLGKEVIEHYFTKNLKYKFSEKHSKSLELFQAKLQFTRK